MRGMPAAVLIVCCVALLGVLQAGAVKAQGPSIFITPNPAAGSQVTAHGSGFCAAPGCSPVTIAMDGFTVARDVTVHSDGTFQAVFGVTAGSYTVTASQVAADGSTLSASTPLFVPAMDFPGSPIPPGGSGTPTAEPPTATGAPPRPSPTGAPPSAPLPTAANGRPTATTQADSASADEDSFPWWWVALAAGGAVAAAGVGAAAYLRRRSGR